jgi:hypothetical protein
MSDIQLQMALLSHATTLLHRVTKFTDTTKEPWRSVRFNLENAITASKPNIDGSSLEYPTVQALTLLITSALDYIYTLSSEEIKEALANDTLGYNQPSKIYRDLSKLVEDIRRGRILLQRN